MREYKMVYSDSLENMVCKGFTIGKMKKHYTWNDSDCTYYSDESDEYSYQSIPVLATIDCK